MFHCFPLFLWISLTRSQSTDPTSPTDQICISGSKLSKVNGIYHHSSWDSNTNGSIYYNSETNLYLYPWIYSVSVAVIRYYLISGDPTRDIVSSHCRILITNPIINPDDCLNKDGTQWMSSVNNESVLDTNLRLVNCNDICVAGNDHSSLDGTYRWLHFNHTRGTSIYQCIDCSCTCSVYLYGWISSYTSGNRYYRWRIGKDWRSAASWTYCWLGLNLDEPYVFNLQGCLYWKSYINSTWDIDHDLVSQKCRITAPNIVPTAALTPISYPSTLFGFETASEADATTEHTVAITLYWNVSIFQCYVSPTEHSTYYGCDTSNKNTTTQCDTDVIPPPVAHGVQIDNEGWDSLIINKVLVQFHYDEDSNVTTYETNTFCSEPLCSESDTFLVEANCCGKEQSMLVIINITDITEPSIVEPVQWTEDHFDFQCNPIGFCIDAITTQSYGSSTHFRWNIDINQGRIHAITSWGINANVDPNYFGVANMKWSSDKQTSFNDNYGRATVVSKCNNFTLDPDDYINGYRVVYNNDTIRGLTFYTKKNKLYHCISNALPNGQRHSGDVIYPNYFLSGFYVSSHSIIDSIAFQFTHINNTNVCKNITNTSNPTMEPTAEPTVDRTSNPTIATTRAPLITDDIIIVTHEDISSEWIAFNITNVNVSCGDNISNVQITDSYFYADKWINYSLHVHDYYEFNDFAEPFTEPISLQIVKINNKCACNEIITGTNIIYVIEGGREFPFGDNFCGKKDSLFSFGDKPSNAVDWSFYYLMCGITLAFFIIGAAALLDAKLFRKNDYFDIMTVVSALFQVLDMLSDVFFAIAVYSTYNVAEHEKSTKLQLLLICILSIVFIVVPVTISLYQLHVASSTKWITDNRVSEWLNTYTKLLYFASVFMGSSFAALAIFNSNMFSLDLFDMGLSKKYFNEFSIKKLYSIILCENTLQTFLSVWYTILLGDLHYIPAVQIVFSLISIIVTIIAIILQKQIRDKQNHVCITIDIEGQCVLDNFKICRNRMSAIKAYISQSVLGVNEKSVEIQKPFRGPVARGLRLPIYVTYTSRRNLAGQYRQLLQNVINDGKLAAVIRDSWELSSVFYVGNVQCELIMFKKQKERGDGAIVIDSEAEELKQSDSFLGDWQRLTKYESVEHELKDILHKVTSVRSEEISLEKYSSIPL